jgi:hypothetical protein
MDTDTAPNSGGDAAPQPVRAPQTVAATEVLQAAEPVANGETDPSPPISIAGHPRAKRMVRRAREIAGLTGFVVAGWMSLSTHSLADALLRATVAGVACQVVVWAAAVLLSRHLITAELRNREQALMQAARRRSEALAGAAQLPGAEASAAGNAQR